MIVPLPLIFVSLARLHSLHSLVGAEAMTRCQCDDAADRASSLYLAASHLYSREGNVFEHGDDGLTRYGWAHFVPRPSKVFHLSLRTRRLQKLVRCQFVTLLYCCWLAS